MLIGAKGRCRHHWLLMRTPAAVDDGSRALAQDKLPHSRCIQAPPSPLIRHSSIMLDCLTHPTVSLASYRRPVSRPRRIPNARSAFDQRLKIEERGIPQSSSRTRHTGHCGPVKDPDGMITVVVAFVAGPMSTCSGHG